MRTRRLRYKLNSYFYFWKESWTQFTLVGILLVFVFLAPASADVVRFNDRSLFMKSTESSVVTDYTLSFGYTTHAVVGSVDLLFCDDPIPDQPCVPPVGLDVSSAVLDTQAGETGFSIDAGTHTANHILLKRSPTMTTPSIMSNYKFEGITNPSNMNSAFAIRIASFASQDSSGPSINVGSVRGQSTTSLTIETQVPPMLVFCLAHRVQLYCTGDDDSFYSDMGDLTDDTTLSADSQMSVGTNATDGFTITANGSPPTAGTTIIDGMDTPGPSVAGQNQFGINVVENTDPVVGINPDGPFANGVPAPDYGVPNQYKYVDGDIIAYSPNVSLMRRFTVSYILNANANLKAGIYTTTINFIASGRF